MAGSTSPYVSSLKAKGENLLPCRTHPRQASGVMSSRPAPIASSKDVRSCGRCSHPFRLHAEKGSSVGLRKGEYSGRNNMTIPGWVSNHSLTRLDRGKLTLSQTATKFGRSGLTALLSISGTGALIHPSENRRSRPVLKGPKTGILWSTPCSDRAAHGVMLPASHVVGPRRG